MRIKRLIAVLVCMAMVFGVLPGMSVSAAIYLTSGKCGESLNWRFNSDGILFIDGSGRMYDNPSWSGVNDSILYSVAVTGAKNIGKSAFSGCTSLGSVFMGSSVYEIGSNAFFCCNNLTDIGLLNVSTIGDEAFYGCGSLASVTLGEYVRYVGVNAFSYCSNLENINVEDGNKKYTSQEGVLFENLSTLKIYPTGKTVKEYRIPSGIIEIEESAFFLCNNLTSISIPKSVTKIDRKAFLGCFNLTEVYYDGSKEEFEAITIESENDILTNANIHYTDSSSASSVTLNKTEIEIAVGESETLTAAVEPSDAENKSVTWKSSNTNVATVEDGVVKALKAGTATITVTTDDGGKTASCTVTVVNPVAVVMGVSLNKTTAEMAVGEHMTLTASVAPSNAMNKNVTWKSSNTAVVTVENGTVKALKAGTATITVITADGGKTASCEVTVTGNEKYKLVGNIQKYVADCSAENIAKYGDFESDAYESVFTAYNDGFVKLNSTVWAIDTENAYEGKRALKNIASGRGSNSGNNFYTSFPIENGKIYLVSFMEYCAYEESSGYGRMTAVIATDTPMNTDGFIECGGYSSWYNATNHIDPRDRIIKAGWNEQSVIIDTSKNADAKYISVINCWGTENENYAIDNFMIYEITESQSYTPVTGVSLSETSKSLFVGESADVNASVVPSNASVKDVIWSSSDESVATVKDGKITAVKAGTATITVTTADGGKTASCAVTVVNPTVAVTGVSLSKTTAKLIVGESATLTATVAPSNATNKSVTWKSSNAAVATVENGVIKAVKAGSSTITVTTTDGSKTASCAVTVVNPVVAVTGVSLNKTTAKLTVGESVTLAATVAPNNATNKNVTWKSSNTAVATVTNGVVKAVKAGSATITVTAADGGKTASCEVTVVNPTVAVTGVSLNKTTAKLTVGDSETLTATVTPSNATNKSVTWKSSNTAIATVENGVIKAVKAGTATITVTTADGGKTASCAVTVVNSVVAVTGVSLNKTTAKLTVGGSETLTATVAPSNATNKSVTWKSSNTAVATVENGVVKAVKAGTATITVTTADGGKTASCAVTVEEKPAQYSADIAVGNASGRAGDTVTVPVVISNNPGIAAFKLKVTYDKERLVPVSIAKGSILSGAITSNIQQGGDMTRFDYVTVYWDNPSDFTADGELFNVVFKIADSAEEGDIPVGISYVNGEVANQKYEDVDLNVTEGNVSVRNVVMGDIFEDGEVNSKDGLKLRQFLAEWAVNLSEREKAAADVFKDGEINSKDGLKLRQFLAEWDVSLEMMSLMDVGSISFEAGSVSAKSGEYVDIPINITENSGVAVFNLRVEFDKEKLIPVSITKGDALEGVITSNIQQGGDMERFDYVTAYWDNPSNVTGTGTAFTVRFKVRDGAEGVAPIRLTSKAGDICDQSFNDLEAKFTDGAVTIGGGEVELPYTVNSFETETPSNGRVYARISVTKNEEREGADALVIAVYNKNGELIDTSAMQGAFEKGQTMTFRSRVFFDDGCTMKAFVWESIEDMVPLSNIVEK